MGGVRGGGRIRRGEGGRGGGLRGIWAEVGRLLKRDRRKMGGGGDGVGMGGPRLGQHSSTRWAGKREVKKFYGCVSIPDDNIYFWLCRSRSCFSSTS